MSLYIVRSSLLSVVLTFVFFSSAFAENIKCIVKPGKIHISKTQAPSEKYRTKVKVTVIDKNSIETVKINEKSAWQVLVESKGDKPTWFVLGRGASASELSPLADLILRVSGEDKKLLVLSYDPIILKRTTLKKDQFCSIHKVLITDPLPVSIGIENTP